MNRKDWRNKKIRDLAIYFCPGCKSGQEECRCCKICKKPVPIPNEDGSVITSDAWCACMLIDPSLVGSLWSVDTYVSSQVATPDVDQFSDWEESAIGEQNGVDISPFNYRDLRRLRESAGYDTITPQEAARRIRANMEPELPSDRHPSRVAFSGNSFLPG